MPFVVNTDARKPSKVRESPASQGDRRDRQRDTGREILERRGFVVLPENLAEKCRCQGITSANQSREAWQGKRGLVKLGNASRERYFANAARVSR